MSTDYHYDYDKIVRYLKNSFLVEDAISRWLTKTYEPRQAIAFSSIPNIAFEMKIDRAKAGIAILSQCPFEKLSECMNILYTPSSQLEVYRSFDLDYVVVVLILASEEEARKVLTSDEIFNSLDCEIICGYITDEANFQPVI